MDEQAKKEFGNQKRRKKAKAKIEIVSIRGIESVTLVTRRGGCSYIKSKLSKVRGPKVLVNCIHQIWFTMILWLTNPDELTGP